MALTVPDACIRMNIVLLRQLLVDGADINKKSERFDYRGQTGLHIACRDTYYNDNMVRLLLDNGSTVNTWDYNQMTPLHIACMDTENYSNNVRPEIVMLLIERGANIEERARGHETPLHLACKHGYFNINTARVLLDNGANINAVNEYGETPLHLACFDTKDERRKTSVELVRLLIDRGANIEAKTSSGETPLNFAIFHRNEEILDELINSGADLNVSDYNGETIIHNFAFALNNVERMIKILNINNTNINERNIDGVTALQLACMIENTENIIALIDRGADIDAVDFSKITNIDRRQRMIEICKRAKWNKNRRKIIQMRFVSNYWRKIRDMEQINAGAITVY
jgi:ankyrin repeat protein